jgi:hypothetical protein
VLLHLPPANHLAAECCWPPPCLPACVEPGCHADCPERAVLLAAAAAAAAAASAGLPTAPCAHNINASKGLPLALLFFCPPALLPALFLLLLSASTPLLLPAALLPPTWRLLCWPPCDCSCQGRALLPVPVPASCRCEGQSCQLWPPSRHNLQRLTGQLSDSWPGPWQYLQQYGGSQVDPCCRTDTRHAPAQLSSHALRYDGTCSQHRVMAMYDGEERQT